MNPAGTRHVVSFSGGKDSTALVLRALEWAETWGDSPEIVFADTGHEHPLTMEYVDRVESHVGLPIRRIRADFTADFERKRAYIATHWPADGVPPERVAQALETLHPTGIPFLDLCMWKGRFPSTKARFCSQELKALPILEQVLMPLLRSGHRVISWQGVRADESAARAALFEAAREDHPRLITYRPLLGWTAEDVFATHRRHGLTPNPLYKLGMGRVGCMPCIHARKAEIREIAQRFPSEIARVAAWEDIVGAVSKRGHSTLFAYDKTPEGHQRHKHLQMPGISNVVEWAMTSRGGRQFDLLFSAPPPVCSSVYGLCEGDAAP
jgi:3'-phosphoadenosine 5'-phosphosulfate sulfotransferase (PAPS reductase)/FAD synthetase